MTNQNQNPANPANDLHEVFGPVIFTYARRQAIDDGILVQLSGPGYEGDAWVPQTVREAGIRFPVAMTAEAFALCVELSPAAKRACNDLKGRLWDVLYMLAHAARRARGDGGVIEFSLHCVTTRVRPSRVRLKAVCGPDDNGEPCITIMLPGQD